MYNEWENFQCFSSFVLDFSHSHMWPPPSLLVWFITHPRKYLLNGISHVVSQFIVSDLEKFAISLGRERVKSLLSKKTNPIRSLAGKKVVWCNKSPAPFSKLDKIPGFTGSDVTMARIIRTAEPTSWPLPPEALPKQSAPARSNYIIE